MHVYVGIGHGIEPNGVLDPGAVAADGTAEHDLATVVCQSVEAALSRSSVPCFVEHNSGASHDPDYRGSTAAVNAGGYDLAVEVHFDSGNAPRGGFGIWYPGSGQGQHCTAAIAGRFSLASLPSRPSYADVRGLYFLRYTHCPAVIWECDRTMAQPNDQQLVVMGEAIAAGVCDYYGATYAAPGGGQPGGAVMPQYSPPIVLEPVVSAWAPPGGGLYQLADSGAVYAWGPVTYAGAPNVDPNAHWHDGGRHGATIGPSPVDGAHYRVVDTAGEHYDY